MIKQIFHLIWNTKRKNTLLFVEITISFLVLFGVYTFLWTGYSIYSVPSGFESDNTYAVSLPFTMGVDSAVKVETKRQILNELSSLSEVAYTSYSNFALPYYMGGWSSDTYIDGKAANAFFLVADRDFEKTHQLEITKGRWFDVSDDHRVMPPIVLNQLYVDSYLDNRDPMGMIINVDGEDREVIGIISHYKYRSDFLSESPIVVMYEPALTARSSHLNVLVKPGTPASFELKLSNILDNTGYLTGFQIQKTSAKRPPANRFFIIPMYIFMFLCIFLILNVAMGLFGIVWYNINNRTAEIGLRRAIGATKPMIYFQLVGEQMVIAMASIVVGLIIAIQFPILNVFLLDPSLYIKGIFSAIITVLTVILVCSILPGRKASKIHPAIALHEE